MTPIQFVGQNIHFTVDLFAALACFAAGWLYFDAWQLRKKIPGLFKWLGFFLLTIGLLANSITWDEANLITVISLGSKLFGYICLIIGDIIDPLQKRPDTSKYLETNSLGFIGISGTWLKSILPAASLAVAMLYWRRATTGLERHLKPLAYTFTIFALADILALASLWRETDNPLLQPLLSDMGPFWIAHHLALLAAATFLTIWVWRYLTKRLLTQIFVMSTTMTVGIVLLATMSVAFLLYRNLVTSSLANLETAAKVLDYAINSQTTETKSAASTISQNPAVQSAVVSTNHKALATLISDLASQNRRLTDITITEADGGVLVRATDPERYGDSRSDDPATRRALLGTTSTSIMSSSGALSPTLFVTSTTPIHANATSSSAIIGTVTTTLALDNSFVDGIKHTTSLDSSVYAGNVRTATTITGPDGASRSVGAKETNPAVAATTLKDGQIWRGSLDLANTPYLGTYLPLKDADNAVVGMLFVGQPQSVLLTAAQLAVRLTFAAATIWLLVVLIPVYLVSRKISRQLR